MKRVRSDSNGDIHDGIEEELEDRYYRFTIHYIRSLMFSNIISRSMYSEMLTSGVIDKIVNKKRTGGNEIIYDTIHEEKACARYIKIKRKKKNMFDALFINGNSSMNIRNTSAAFDPKSKMIINAIMGTGPKEKDKLGNGVYKQWGKAKDGFNVVSNQFSIHYFFNSLMYHGIKAVMPAITFFVGL